MNRCCRVALCQPWKRAPWTLGGGARPDAAPQPLPAAVCPHAEGAQTGVTGRLCARRRVSGASPSDPACSFQGLRPSARPPGPDDRGTSLSVCWAQLPRALAWQAGSAGLGGREPAWPRGPLGAGAAHWPRGDPHGAADTGRLVLWNETPLSASLRQLRPRSFISEKKMWFC